MAVLIYGLADPETGYLRYVGKTKEKWFSDRMHDHASCAKRNGQTKVQRWVRGLWLRGKKPEAFVIEKVGDDDWEEAEQFWIAYYRFIGCPLTNHCVGGRGAPGRKQAKSSMEKTRASNIGRKHSEETKAAMRAAWTPERKVMHATLCRERGISQEQRSKISKANSGRPISAEHRRRISEHFRGKKLSAEHIRKAAAGTRLSWTEERRAAQAERMRTWRRSQPSLRGKPC